MNLSMEQKDRLTVIEKRHVVCKGVGGVRVGV